MFMTSFENAFVKLNVGGTVFETRLETLGRGSKQGSQVSIIIFLFSFAADVL